MKAKHFESCAGYHLCNRDRIVQNDEKELDSKNRIGKFADIAIGDAWYPEIQSEQGRFKWVYVKNLREKQRANC